MKRYSQGSKVIAENTIALIKTNGLMVLDENYKLRPLSKPEYFILKEDIGTGIKGLLTEGFISRDDEYRTYLSVVNTQRGKNLHEVKKSAFKVSKFREFGLSLLEANGVDSKVGDQTVTNPDTGRDIKVSTALGYDSSHPAYKKAKDVVDKSKGEDDGHGDHHHDNLSATETVLTTVADVATKALHIPGLDKIAGQGGAIYGKMKEVVKDAEGAEGVLGKVKALGKAGKEAIGKWADDKKKDFVNSLSDENTGERKSLGKVIGGKMKAIGKGIVNGLKEEAKHIAHDLKDGAGAVKELAKSGFSKEVLKDPKWQKKLANGVRGVGTSAVIGMAVASGPMGMVAKATQLATNPGDIVKSMLMASTYSDLQRKGLVNVIRESKGSDLNRLRKVIIKEAEAQIDKIDSSYMLEIAQKAGGQELQETNSPFEEYDENEMDILVASTKMCDDINDARKGALDKGE